MADSVITEPSSSAISLTGYQRIINKLTKQSKGLAAVDFDDYADGATAPSVVAGGVYEINGTYYEVTADTQITGMSVVSTTYYIYSDSGVWTASTTAPEWSESKQGWYDPSDANSRCFFKITTDSGGEYDDRYKLHQLRNVGDDVDFGGSVKKNGTSLASINAATSYTAYGPEDYPIGSMVLVNGNPVTRTYNVSIYLSTTQLSEYTFVSGGDQLPGQWRIFGGSESQNVSLCQRIS